MSKRAAKITLRVGDRVRVGRSPGVVYELPSGECGNGITVTFPDSDLPCICEPESVKFVSRPRKRAELDPRTLRSVGRELRKLGKDFLQTRPNMRKAFDDAKGQLLMTWGSIYLRRARDLERKRPKLTPATTLCGPHERKRRKPVKR